MDLSVEASAISLKSYYIRARQTLPLMGDDIMSNFVFVIDSNKKPLDPCRPAKARVLLDSGKAAVFRKFPFTIILKYQVENRTTQDYQMKIDPGSKTTGVAIVRKETDVIWVANLIHRGMQIKLKLENRRATRRNRHTRYRQARFLNRTRPKGWLAPSLDHRVKTIKTWVNRIMKVLPISGFSQELVRFDIQKMINPEITGVEYQHGELFGYEIKEYLLEKWGRKCVYCGEENTPLEVEHIHAKSKGGSNKVSNLTLACVKCNQKKSNKSIELFLENKPELLSKIKSKAKAPLRDATAVNSTRWKLFRTLKEFDMPVKTGSGGQTKFNRKKFNFKKDHWIDAACVGEIDSLTLFTTKPLLISAKGHGNKQFVRMNKYGFPASNAKQKVLGWKTGDFVNVIKGKNIRLKCVRLKTVRFKGNFDIRIDDKIFSVSKQHIVKCFASDGYNYQF